MVTKMPTPGTISASADDTRPSTSAASGEGVVRGLISSKRRRPTSSPSAACPMKNAGKHGSELDGDQRDADDADDQQDHNRNDGNDCEHADGGRKARDDVPSRSSATRTRTGKIRKTSKMITLYASRESMRAFSAMIDGCAVRGRPRRDCVT